MTDPYGETSLAYRQGWEISALRRAVREYQDAVCIAASPDWSPDAKARLLAGAVKRAEEALTSANKFQVGEAEAVPAPGEGF
jgi:hypothetical protein